jgi:hypothetical protein
MREQRPRTCGLHDRGQGQSSRRGATGCPPAHSRTAGAGIRTRAPARECVHCTRRDSAAQASRQSLRRSSEPLQSEFEGVHSASRPGAAAACACRSSTVDHGTEFPVRPLTTEPVAGACSWISLVLASRRKTRSLRRSTDGSVTSACTSPSSPHLRTPGARSRDWRRATRTVGLGAPTQRPLPRQHRQSPQGAGGDADGPHGGALRSSVPVARDDQCDRELAQPHPARGAKRQAMARRAGGLAVDGCSRP